MQRCARDGLNLSSEEMLQRALDRGLDISSVLPKAPEGVGKLAQGTKAKSRTAGSKQR